MKRSHLPIVFSIFLGFVLSSPSPGQDQPDRSSLKVGPAFLPDFMAQPDPEPPPLGLRKRSFAIEPIAELGKAAEEATDLIGDLQAWNAAGRHPFQIGFTRELPELRTVDLAQRAAGERGGETFFQKDGGIVWATSVRVEGAFRLRLHLRDVRLPEGVRMWVYGEEEHDFTGPFGLELLDPDGELWTPSVGGEALHLEVELPAGIPKADAGAGFEIDRVAEEVEEADLLPAKAGGASCYVDSRCVPVSDLGFKRFPQAVARLSIMKGGKYTTCTGALLSDSKPSWTPYMMTAEHCVSNQKEASSLEALWDYRPVSCGGRLPRTFPRSQGATLLKSKERMDFAFLLLKDVPKGRSFLGWDASLMHGRRPNSVFKRLSHPGVPGYGVIPQSFAEVKVVWDTRSWLSCTTHHGSEWNHLDQGADFIHTIPIRGDSFKGSSGSPLIREGGFFVGHQIRICGPDDSVSCGTDKNAIDTSFYAIFHHVRSYLYDGPKNPQ